MPTSPISPWLLAWQAKASSPSAWPTQTATTPTTTGGYQTISQMPGYSKYLYYLQAYQREEQINPRQLAERIEKLKGVIRSRSDIQSAIGRDLAGRPQDSPRYQTQAERYKSLQTEIREAEQLRNELIRIRKAHGVRVPAPPEEAPKQRYPYGYDPGKETIKLPSGEVVVGVRGYTQTASGELKEVIIKEDGSQVTYDVKTKKPTAIQTEDYYQRLDEDSIYYRKPVSEVIRKSYVYPKAGPPGEVASAGQFVDVINQQYGTQVLVGKKVGDRYEVYFNPNVTPPESMKDLVKERLTSYGFAKEGGKYVYETAPLVLASSPQFDFTREASVKAGAPAPIEEEPTVSFVKDGVLYYNIGRGEGVRESLMGMEAGIPKPGEEWHLSGWKVTPGSKPKPGELLIVKTPITEFYKTDYAMQLTEPLRGFEKSIGAEIRTPLGKVGAISAAPWLIAAGVETYGKSLFAAGSFFFRAGEAAIRSQEGVMPWTPREREEIGSELIASKEHLIISPFIVASMTGGILEGGATKIAAVSPSTGKPIATSVQHAKVVSTKFTDLGVTREFARGGRTIFEIVTPKGASQYTGLAAKAAIEPLTKTIGMASAPASKILGPAVKWGVTSGGLQTAFEFAVPTLMASGKGDYRYAIGKGIEQLQTPESQKRIATVAVGGATLGALFGLGSYTKPFIQAKKMQYKQAISYYEGIPKTVLVGTVKAGVQAYEGQKYLYFLAGSGKYAVSGPPRSIGYGLAEELTAHGLNPYERIKPAIAGLRQKPQTMRPPSVSVVGMKFVPTDIQLRRERYAGLVQQFQMAKPKAKQSIPPMPMVASAEAFATPTKLAQQRQERIWEDISMDILLREAGRTKTERVEAIRQAGRTGLRSGVGLRTMTGPRQGLKSRIGEWTIVTPRLGEIEIPRLAITERVRLLEPPRERPPITPALLIPGIGLGIDERKKRGRAKGRKGKKRREYAPSLVGLTYGITEKRPKRIFTSIGIRGIPRGKVR